MAHDDKNIQRTDPHPSTRNASFFSRIFCQHDWEKRQNWHQPPRAEGKTAWKCNGCGKVVTKLSWQTPYRHF
jgi:hypothetical protein